MPPAAAAAWSGTLVTRRPGHRRARDPAVAAPARAAAGARSRGGAGIHRPRLAAAVPEARRPGARRRRRGTRRPARRQALPAARGGAGIADHAGGGDRRARPRRRVARVRGASVPSLVRRPADRRLAADPSPHGRRSRHRRLRRHLGRLLLHALRRDRRQGDASSASASPTATSCCRRRPACSSRRRPVRCWPTTASTPCASSSRSASATPSARG